MYVDDIQSDIALASALLTRNAPDLAGLPVTPVLSDVTDNAMYRVGDHLAMRLPRRLEAVRLLEKEARILPNLGRLPLDVPQPQKMFPASADFPYPWSLVRWIEGHTAHLDELHTPADAGRALAGFLAALRVTDADGAPLAGAANHRRGVPLRELADQTLHCIAALADEIDAVEARALWRAALAMPYDGPPVWLHGDLKADNLLARDGRLVAVIDWGLAAAGDPAVDLAPAWTWLDRAGAEAFRTATDLPEPYWQRAKGWALYGAVIALEYYRETPKRPCRNPALCATSRATLQRLGLR